MALRRAGEATPRASPPRARSNWGRCRAARAIWSASRQVGSSGSVGEGQRRIAHERIDRAVVERSVTRLPALPRGERDQGRAQERDRVPGRSAASNDRRRRGREDAGDLEVAQGECPATPVEDLQHADRALGVGERCREDGRRDVAGGLRDGAVEPRIGRHVGDRQLLAGRERVARDARSRIDVASRRRRRRPNPRWRGRPGGRRSGRGPRRRPPGRRARPSPSSRSSQGGRHRRRG